MKKINLKTIITIAIMQIVLMLLITTSFAESTATITVETARLRKEASETSTVLELISQGEKIEVLSQEGNWYKVQYKQMVGYVRADLLEITNTENNENEVNAQNTNANATSNENEQTPETSIEPENQNTTNGSTENANNIETPENTQTEENNQNAENAENQENEAPEKNSENSINNEEIQENNKTQENEESTLGTYKTKENITVKISPLINSLNIKNIATETNINVTEIINGWAYITDQEISGWCRLDKLEKTEEAENSNEQETNTNNQSQNNEQTSNEATQNNEENTNNQEENEQTPINMVSTKYINSQTVNVRSEPSTTSSIIMQLTLNTEVQVLSEENSWYKIKVNDKEGYVASTLLSDTKQETSRGSDTPRELIGENQEEDKTNQEQNQSNNNTNQENNANNKNTTNQNQEEAVNKEPVSTNKGAEVVSYAMQFKGSKYVYGGTSPSGFDCSGLTYYVYKHFGITLVRTAAGQYSSNGTSVSKSELKPGDLVMFCNPVNHVGIYIGNGQMIHAANPSRGVTIDTINSGYYYTNYRGAKRIFN